MKQKNAQKKGMKKMMQTNFVKNVKMIFEMALKGKLPSEIAYILNEKNSESLQQMSKEALSNILGGNNVNKRYTK